MPKSPEKVVHKVEPRGEETTEAVAEGSVNLTSPDAPPEVHAASILEMDPNDYIRERTVGPTDPVGAFEVPGEEEEPEETPGEEPGGEPPTSPTEDEGGKEASSEAKDESEREQMIPRERFDQLNERLKQSEKDSQMLQWILEDPKRFAATIAGQPSDQGPPPTEAESQKPLLEEPTLPTGEDLERISDKELFDISVKQQTVRVLNDLLPGVFNDLQGLKQFRGNMEDLVMKSATGPDKQPLFPRWEELRPVVQQVMQQHPTVDRQEAYFLAERKVPSGAPSASANLAASPDSNPVDANRNVPEQPPVAEPKKAATPEMVRASKLVELGRSAGAYASHTKPTTPKEAVEMAMKDHGFPED